VGVRPTIGDGKLTVETHLLDGARELYGARLRLSFVRWLREEVKFDDLGALRDQMARDAEDARQLFRKISI
jgi:riboflavin kinase/FMN adenylyltransferase